MIIIIIIFFMWIGLIFRLHFFSFIYNYLFSLECVISFYSYLMRIKSLQLNDITISLQKKDNNNTGLQRNWGKHKNTRFYPIWGCWIQVWNPFLLITSSFLDLHSVHFVHMRYIKVYMNSGLILILWDFYYFDCKIGDQDKSWAPHICCKLCYNGLTAWFNGKKAAFTFAVPMVWREPRNHADDCYFCLTKITGFNASSRKKIKYPNRLSAMRPVPHSDDLPVPTPPVNKDLLSSSDEKMPSWEDSAESISLEYSVNIFRITQENLNDLARDLYLSKHQSELLASRLKQWNLVQEDVRITSFRYRNK